MRNYFALKFIFLSCFIFIMTSCSIGKAEPNSNTNPAVIPETVQTFQPDATQSLGEQPMSDNLNSKCLEAIQDAQDLDNWTTSFDKGAQTACAMFDKYLSSNGINYEKVRFITEPASSYYFMMAYIEREQAIIRAINTETGVIERNDDAALDKFVKSIHILDSSDNARRLAKMIHCFHAGNTMRLVTQHHNKSSRAEQNAPDFKKNDDGSFTLTYDLIHSGRSNAVEQCILNVSADYKVSLNCKTK